MPSAASARSWTCRRSPRAEMPIPRGWRASGSRRGLSRRRELPATCAGRRPRPAHLAAKPGPGGGRPARPRRDRGRDRLRAAGSADRVRPGGIPAARRLPAPSASSGRLPRPFALRATGATPSPSGPPGSGLSSARPTTLTAAQAEAVFPILLPSRPDGSDRRTRSGSTSSAASRSSGRPTRPATDGASRASGWSSPSSRARSTRGYFEKLLDAGSTIEPVTVAGPAGLLDLRASRTSSSMSHPTNEPTFDARRLVGDTSPGRRPGDVPDRVGALGREAAIRIANTLR